MSSQGSSLPNVSLRNQIASFAQCEDESLYEACESFNDLLRLCPHHGLQKWMGVQTFYNGITQSMRSMVDTATSGMLMSKTENEACNLIEQMTLNNYQWSNECGQPKRVGGKFNFDGFTLLTVEMDVMTQRLDRLNVNVVNSCAPSVTCDRCGS